MLRTNLSTRPFYNERAVHAVLGMVSVLVVGAIVFNVTRIVALSGRHTELSLQADRDEEAARVVNGQTAAIRRDADREELDGVAAAVREANTLIGRRTFSWTEFFNQIEATLPADVMMTSVRPEVDAGAVLVSMVVIGRRVEDIDQFMEQLESTGAFAELLSRQEEATEDGMYRSTLRGRYLAGGREALGKGQPSPPAEYP